MQSQSKKKKIEEQKYSIIFQYDFHFANKFFKEFSLKILFNFILKICFKLNKSKFSFVLQKFKLNVNIYGALKQAFKYVLNFIIFITTPGGML